MIHSGSCSHQSGMIDMNLKKSANQAAWQGGPAIEIVQTRCFSEPMACHGWLWGVIGAVVVASENVEQLQRSLSGVGHGLWIDIRGGVPEIAHMFEDKFKSLPR